LHNDSVIKLKNLEAIIFTVSEIVHSTAKHKTVGKNHLWTDVPQQLIVDFLNNFIVFGSEDELGLRTRMPIKFIKKYAVDTQSEWDVALYNGEGNLFKIKGESISINKEKRKLSDSKGNYHEILNRQVSSGSSEAIVLDDDTRKRLKNQRKDIRAKMTKPLLMLHVLETEEDTALAAFGISFPGGINSGNHTIKLKINTVFLKDLLEELDSDD